MKLLVLMSHRLSEEQLDDARHNWGITSVEYLPDALQKKWSQVSPHGPLDLNAAMPFFDWIKTNGRSQDRIVIQGEYGLTVFFVEASRALALIPLYATCERIYHEEPDPDGNLICKHLFRHVNFREYRFWQNTSTP